MTETIDLFADYSPRPNGAPFNKGSDTSREAAESVKPHLARLEKIVFDYIESCGRWGSTCDQAEAHFNDKITHQSVSARFNRLEKLGRIERTEEKRKTRSGRNAFVYRARA